MASPHVAGIAALILEDEPFLPSSDLKARILSQTLDGVLQDTATHPNYIGGGSPNLLAQSNPPTIFEDTFESGNTTRWNL